MAVQKPQKPLTVNEQEIYPMTCADQIVLEDGTRMRADGKAKDSLLFDGETPNAYHQLVAFGTADYGKMLTCNAAGLVWSDAPETVANVEGVEF